MEYVIEHLDEKVFEWCFLEYRHISLIVGKENLLFTNVTSNKLEKLGKVNKKSVVNLKLKKAIVLDPDAKETLTAEDCEKADFLIFGGILGDYPPKKRTKQALSSKMKCLKRNLGEKQMSTDTAVYVAKKIAGGKKLSELRFAYMLEVKTGENESMELPYQFVIENGKPVLAPGFIEFISEYKGF